MYSTCLFCTQSLGRNESVEAFPVGRRLAFDAAKGRRWVVCPRCERWNLTPLEERWEAVEQCERLFRDTRLRVSTEHVGLAKLKDGTVLVRIGAPQRPEMAAWRYGDQFGRRRRKHLLMAGGIGIAAAAGVTVAGPVLGLVGMGAIGPAFNVFTVVNGLYQSRRTVRVPLDDGSVVEMTRRQLGKAQLTAFHDGVWRLHIAHALRGKRPFAWRVGATEQNRVLTGDAAVRAAGAILPKFNESGASRKGVQNAVELLEQTRDPDALFAHVAAESRRRFKARTFQIGDEFGLKNIPHTMRLALEMAAHEEQERRALDGELADLERAWRDAETIAAIADDLLLPDAVEPAHQRLRTRANDSAT